MLFVLSKEMVSVSIQDNASVYVDDVFGDYGVFVNPTPLVNKDECYGILLGTYATKEKAESVLRTISKARREERGYLDMTQ